MWLTRFCGLRRVTWTSCMTWLYEIMNERWKLKMTMQLLFWKVSCVISLAYIQLWFGIWHKGQGASFPAISVFIRNILRCYCRNKWIWCHIYAILKARQNRLSLRIWRIYEASGENQALDVNKVDITLMEKQIQLSNPISKIRCETILRFAIFWMNSNSGASAWKTTISGRIGLSAVLVCLSSIFYLFL